MKLEFAVGLSTSLCFCSLNSLFLSTKLAKRGLTSLTRPLTRSVRPCLICKETYSNFSPQHKEWYIKKANGFNLRKVKYSASASQQFPKVIKIFSTK